MPNVTEPLTQSAQTFGGQISAFLPKFFIAVLILIVGILIAVAVAKAVKKILTMLNVDKAIDRPAVNNFLQQSKMKFSLSGGAAWLAKWSIIIITLIAVSDTLGLQQLTNFFSSIILFIPNVIVAVVILVVGIIVASFLESIVRRALFSLNAKSSETLATLAKWSVIIFTFMVVLVQLGIAPSLINIMLIGFTAMIAIAGGVAFGLGGRDLAKDILNRLRDDLSNRPGPQQM